MTSVHGEKGKKMSRLIDYDEFKWQLTHWRDNEGWSHQIDKMVFNLMELDEAMEKTPTVDPIKHGHWIMKLNGYGTCSNCKKCSLDIMGGVHSNFCPNCGAKMDEVEDDG